MTRQGRREARHCSAHNDALVGMSDQSDDERMESSSRRKCSIMNHPHKRSPEDIAFALFFSFVFLYLLFQIIRALLP